MIRKAWMAACLLGLLVGQAQAAPPGDKRLAISQLESSMRLSGDIEVEVDGSVARYAIDDAERLPKGIAGLIERSVAGWKFKPVTSAGQPARLRNRMSLLLVAKKLEGNDYLVRLQAADFLPLRREQGTEVTRLHSPPPEYPVRELTEGVTGTVYLLVKVGRDGRVQDAIAEQVNLRTLGSQVQLARWRNGLADASLRAVRQWTYTPPARGPWMDEPFWLVRHPVDFLFRGAETVEDGKWRAYVAGPRQSNPWSDRADADADSSPEAVATGGLHQVGSGELHLLTPLGEQG